jgi:hypothetical protein
MNTFFSKQYNQNWMNPKPKETKDQNINQSKEIKPTNNKLVNASLGLAIIGSGVTMFGMMMDLALNLYSQAIYSSKEVVHSKTADEIAIVGGGIVAVSIVSLLFAMNKKEKS